MNAGTLIGLLLVGLVATVFMLSGCAPATVQFNHGATALLYADIKEMYGAVRVDLVRACSGSSPKLDAPTCARLQEAEAQLAVADVLVREAIKNPKAELDMEKLGVFVRAALKAGAASQTGGLSGVLLK